MTTTTAPTKIKLNINFLNDCDNTELEPLLNAKEMSSKKEEEDRGVVSKRHFREKKQNQTNDRTKARKMKESQLEETGGYEIKWYPPSSPANRLPTTPSRPKHTRSISGKRIGLRFSKNKTSPEEIKEKNLETVKAALDSLML